VLSTIRKMVNLILKKFGKNITSYFIKLNKQIRELERFLEIIKSKDDKTTTKLINLHI